MNAHRFFLTSLALILWACASVSAATDPAPSQPQVNFVRRIPFHPKSPPVPPPPAHRFPKAARTVQHPATVRPAPLPNRVLGGPAASAGKTRQASPAMIGGPPNPAVKSGSSLNPSQMKRKP